MAFPHLPPEQFPLLRYSHCRMTKVDEDGVPRVVQQLRYFYSSMMFEAELFNGDISRWESTIVPAIGLCQTTPTPEQWTDAYNYITAQYSRERTYG